MKYFKKYINYLLTILMLFIVGFSTVKAALLKDPKDLNPSGTGNKQMGAFNQGAGFEVTDIGNVMAVIIQAFLGMLGIVFIILIITAGYKYMNARGNEEKVDESLAQIRRAIIGLLIVVSAYAITYFVFNAIDWAGSGGGGGGVG
ncbi:MAG: MMCAP2_0565 family pilin-like conjugal transfer protein [Patescibacteria group bacterium]